MNDKSKINSRLTALDSEYPSCSETYAELRIYPSSHSAEDITELLGIPPTASQNANSLIKNSRGRTRKTPRTGWFLSSEGKVNSKDLREHLNWILQKLSGSGSALMSLQKDNARMTVSCTWWSASGHGGPVLWPEQMRALADLNLECSFDVYFLDDD